MPCSRRSDPPRMVVVEYDLVLRRTEKAVLLRGTDEAGRKAEDWWPTSQCPDLAQEGVHDPGDGPDYFEAPEWLAREKVRCSPSSGPPTFTRGEVLVALADVSARLARLEDAVDRIEQA